MSAVSFWHFQGYVVIWYSLVFASVGIHLFCSLWYSIYAQHVNIIIYSFRSIFVCCSGPTYGGSPWAFDDMGIGYSLIANLLFNLLFNLDNPSFLWVILVYMSDILPIYTGSGLCIKDSRRPRPKGAGAEGARHFVGGARHLR